MNLNARAIPAPLEYSSVKPQSVYSTMNLSKMTPTSTVSDHPSTTSIRVLVNETSFMDPHNTYVNITVKAVNLKPYEIRRISNSGSSLISELIIRSSGVELERIRHYDHLASILNNMTYSSEQRLAHQFEGFGNISRAQTNPNNRISSAAAKTVLE